MRLLPALVFTSSICLSGVVAMANEGASIVATVNGVELTKAELNQEIAKIVPMERAFHGGMSEEKLQEIKVKGMATLIDMELQYQDGLAKGHKLDKKDMEREIDLLASKYPVREAYDEAVENAGFTEKSMERFISRNIIAKKMKELEVDKKVNITDSMVAAYYEKNTQSYMKPDEFRASIILINVPPSSLSEERRELRKKAEKIYQQLKEGADFAGLAAKSSDDMSRVKGGDLGYFHAGRSDDPEFDAVISQLKVGETSGIMESLKGYYMVKLTEKNPPRQLPFTEVKGKIRAMLLTSEKERLFSTWMDGLKNKAKIVYTNAETKMNKGQNP